MIPGGRGPREDPKEDQPSDQPGNRELAALVEMTVPRVRKIERGMNSNKSTTKRRPGDGNTHDLRPVAFIYYYCTNKYENPQSFVA